VVEALTAERPDDHDLIRTTGDRSRDSQLRVGRLLLDGVKLDRNALRPEAVEEARVD
jgi:hypothetical protein